MPGDLPPEIAYAAKLVAALSAADRALGQLGGIVRSLPNERLLLRSFMRREAVLSSRIEGTRASLDDLFLFEVNPRVEETVPDVREVGNYVRALYHGITRMRHVPLTLHLMRELHEVLLRDTPDAKSHLGRFRNRQNWIGPSNSTCQTATFVPPPPEHVIGCLERLERFINAPSELPLLVRLAMMHYQFEAIHPFEDGNGRLGRLFISLLLVSQRALRHPILSLSAYLESHRGEYYARLQGISQRGEWEEWITFIARGVADQSTDALERTATLHSLRSNWTQSCQTARTSALLIKLIDGLFDNPYITVGSAAAMLGVGVQSAQYNIDRLVSQGILSESTGRRRNRIYVARRIIEVLEEVPALDLPTEGG
jgi:Fic family protein